MPDSAAPTPSPLPPCVILCGPQMGENIGACARAMKNCGLDDLRLVDPRDGWPNPAANAMAAHAEDIVEAAQVFDTLEEAIVIAALPCDIRGYEELKLARIAEYRQRTADQLEAYRARRSGLDTRED